MRSLFVVVAGLAALAAVVPGSAAAQAASDPLDRQRHPRWEIPGFDFSPNGGWRVRARQVSAARRQALRAGRFDVLNAPMRGADLGAPVVSGTVQVPALLISYADVDSVAFMRDTALYSTLLFGATPPVGNPYTLRTYYEQMSSLQAGAPLFSMQGKVMGWVRLPNAENTYTGTPGPPCLNPFGATNCNGIFSSAATNAMQNGFRQALSTVDVGIDFSQFDNDGPDLIPNSVDDDGYVDMMMFAHATQDGSCGGNNHIWAHRYSLRNATQTAPQDYVTNDAANGGGFIRISSYFVQSGLGGNATGCDQNQIMSIGTAAHEFGHALGLPDLYDTGGETEGAGRWSLMGSGNFSRPASPSRMDAWSLSELGWVTLAIPPTTGTYTFGPAPTADTAFVVNVSGANPRGEYFLLENRQPVLADTALIPHACLVWYQPPQGQTPPVCPGGMLIWHVDGTKINALGNSANVGPIHGLKVEEADGARDLWCETGTGATVCNRGDAGDLYPSALAAFGFVPAKTASTAFGIGTNPGAVKNSDGSFVGFAIDSIRQVEPGGEMAFRLRFGQPTIVRANDTNAVIVFDGANYNVFRNLLDDGSPHTVSVASPQLSGDGRTRWNFNNWSDNGAQTHPITGVLAGDTIIAIMIRDFRLVATTSGAGSIASSPTVVLAGELISEGTPIELTATPDPGVGFGGWSGDTTTANPVLVLPMHRPYTVVASFVAALSISTTATRPNGVMGAAYVDTLRAAGGTGTFNWVVTSGALPTGVILEATTGALAGFPRQTGTFNYTATVTSGGQSQFRAFTFSVTAPTLVTADVVTQMVGPGSPLNADAVRYLDYLGNNNGTFDIGDFLAWVKTTGAPLTAETMARLAEITEGRP